MLPSLVSTHSLTRTFLTPPIFLYRVLHHQLLHLYTFSSYFLPLYSLVRPLLFSLHHPSSIPTSLSLSLFHSIFPLLLYSTVGNAAANKEVLPLASQEEPNAVSTKPSPFSSAVRPATYRTDARRVFPPGIKQPGPGADHYPPSNAKVKNNWS